MKTAANGVAKGFDAPDPKGYGAYPRGYAERIRRHLEAGEAEWQPRQASVAEAVADVLGGLFDL